MKITRKQIRKIISEEVNREFPISYYSDEVLMQEGLLDFLGGLFDKLIDFFTGDAEEATTTYRSNYQSAFSDNFAAAAKEQGLEDVKSEKDLDMENKDHQKVFYAALAPVEVKAIKATMENLAATDAVKDWTPADDSEEATKKWQEENGEASTGLYKAAGAVIGALQFYEQQGISAAGDAAKAGDTAIKDSPAATAQWVAEAGTKAIISIFEAAKAGGLDAAGEVIEGWNSVGSKAIEVAKKIAESGKEEQADAKKESLELRKYINQLVLQERARNI